MELEDQHWFPAVLRNQQTEFIGFMVSAFGLYKPLVPLLRKLLANQNEWTDCCSGSAGPVLYFQYKSLFTKPILLTDKFPNKDFKNEYLKNLNYCNDPLDVIKDNIPGTGLITMFNAFHHFNELEKQVIIEKIITSNRPFLIVEILQPTIFEAIKIFVTTTLGQLLLAPFVKPFSFLRLIFTYILPINLITVLWDGLVSVRVAIPLKKLQNLATANSNKSYIVEAGNFKRPLAVITYLTGYPIV